MNNFDIATAIALRDLKCGSIETLNDRILLQKKIFLAQDIGLPLGYGYGWYIHGPYSTDLTAAAYQIIPEGFDSIEKRKFKDYYDEIISKVNRLERDIIKKGLKISVVKWYELLASIAYWSKRIPPEKEKIIAKIKETKPQFSDEIIQAGYLTYNDFKEHEQNEAKNA